jgi:ABC-type nitrate/sulfonate/bicarbonate transport system substrate-binding protein
MIRRKLGFIAAIAMMVASAASAQALAQDLQKVRVRLDWKGGGQHAPFYLAKQSGFYKDEGIDLEIISGSGSSDVVKQVGAGAIEFGVVDAIVLTQAAQQRVPLKAIAAYYLRTPICVISPKAKPITQPSQLTGIKLGAKKGSATFQGLIAVLSANSIPLEQVKLVDIGFTVAPLLVGQVDALMGFTMNQTIELENAGMQVNVMPISDFGVDVYGLTIVGNSSLIEKNPELVKAFLRATHKGMALAAKDPAAAVDAIVKQVEAADGPLEGRVLAATAPFWTGPDTAGHELGWQSAARWQSTIELANKLGLIDRPIATDELFTNAFLDSNSKSQ